MKTLLIIDVEQKELDLLDEYKKQNMIVDIGYYYDETQGWSFTRKKLLSIKPLPKKKEMTIIKRGQYEESKYIKGYNDCLNEIVGEKE